MKHANKDALSVGMSGLFPEGTFSVVFKMMLTDYVETRLQVVGESEKLSVCTDRPVD